MVQEERKVLGALLEQYNGILPFDAFMENALFHSHVGYYTQKIKDIGPRGDFTTAPVLNPSLGAAVASWARTHRILKNTNHWKRGAWSVIEVGAGNGELACAFLSSFSVWERWGFTYHIVEISPRLKQLQKKKIKYKNVKWHATMESALQACQGKALIFSNELVDAFPCQQFVWRKDSWKEICLCLNKEGEGKNGNALKEYERESSFKENTDSRSKKIKEGQRIEVHQSFKQWWQGWNSCLKEGKFLIIDYGDEEEALRRSFPYGTLRAYFKQLRLEDDEIYRRFSNQDITADVNFTDLKRWGKEMGWEEDFYGTQRDFILQYGKGKKCLELPSELDGLIQSDGAGGAFKVYCASKKKSTPGTIRTCDQ